MVSRRTIETVKTVMAPMVEAGAVNKAELDELLGGRKAESFLTAREAAERLKVTIKTIRLYVKAGRLRQSRIGRRAVRIPESSVSALLNGEGKEERYNG